MPISIAVITLLGWWRARIEYPTYNSDMTYSDFASPEFDCDFHLYETADAFTRYLPSEYADVVQLVEVKGRTKIAVRGHGVSSLDSSVPS